MLKKFTSILTNKGKQTSKNKPLLVGSSINLHQIQVDPHGNTSSSIINLPGGLQDIRIGAAHSLALIQNRLVSWGNNNYGQCGPVHDNIFTFSITGDDDDEVFVPSLIGRIEEEIDQIASGDFHNLALTRDGKLLSWGSGLLGNGSEIFDMNPCEIDHGLDENEWKVDKIFAAASYSMALVSRFTLDDSRMKSSALIWGHVPTPTFTEKILSPVRIPGKYSSIVDIIPGRSHFSLIHQGSVDSDDDGLYISSFGTFPSNIQDDLPPYHPTFDDKPPVYDYTHAPFNTREISPNISVIAGHNCNIYLIDGDLYRHCFSDSNDFVKISQTKVETIGSSLNCLFAISQDGTLWYSPWSSNPFKLKPVPNLTFNEPKTLIYSGASGCALH